MRKTKVLIVDDEPAIREVLEMILQEWGYDVRLACDGAEAKSMVEAYDPDVVISDVVMPQLSGLDLLRCLKAGNPNRPVILVTAHASIDLAVESMKQGAQDFTSKAMREVYDLIQSLSSTDASAIITGESGTGKELAARTIHRMSSRANGPFIAVNSSAIPETLIESEVFGHEKGAFTGAVGTRPGCFEL